MPPEPKSEQKQPLEIALDYALHGLPVFPCVPLTKRPYTSNGFKAATRDAEQIKTWWHQWPDAMIGCPMGEESGLYCVDLDIDKETGEAIGETSATALGIMADLQTGVRATTHSGGSHYYFADPGEGFGNTASKIADRIDTRGKGGYTILPGSVTSEGKAYAWDFLGVVEVGLDSLPELPDSIIAALKPKAPEPTLSQQASPTAPANNILDINLGTPIAPGAGSEAAWAAKALDLECNALATASEGRRNHQLNTSAFSLAQIVAAGHLEEQLVRTRLMDAATACGLIASDGLEQCRATFQSGWTAGFAQPRSPKPDDTWPKLEPMTVGSGSNDRQKNQQVSMDPDPALNDPDSTPEPLDNEHAASIEARPLNLEWFDDIAPTLADSYIVKGVLGEGAMSVVYGPSNSGKTFFALDLAYHVAINSDWRGHRVNGGSVLYLAAEGGKGLLNRIAALRQQHGVCDVPLAVKRAGLDLLKSEADLQHIVDLAREVNERAPLRMIFIDTLSRVIAGGDENSAQDMTALIRNIGAIQEATQAHICIVHHTGKDTARGARGHSSLRAATDTEIEVETDDTDGETIRAANVTKQRDYSGGQVYPFNLKSVELGTDSDGDQVTSCIVEQADSAEFEAKKQQYDRLGGNQKIIIEAFELLNSEGVGGLNPGGVGFPEPGQYWTIPLQDLRRVAQGKMTGSDPGKLFRQAFSALSEQRGLICMADNLVWRTDKPKKGMKS